MNRVRAEVGTGAGLERLGLGGARPGRIELAAALRASDRHPPRAGGRIDLEVELPAAFTLGAGAGRAHFAPTFDQEVLVPGRPVAEPERLDQGELRLKRRGRVGLGLLVARRHVGESPLVLADVATRRWPQFRFTTIESRHWEVRGVVTSPRGPLGLEAGVWGSRLFGLDEPSGLPPFLPAGVARAFARFGFALFGGDLVIEPRIDALVVGERDDFAGRPLAGHARLDATITGVMGKDADLELRFRNLLDRRYPLAVLDPATGELYVDSGRMTTVGLRWRLAN